MSYRRALGASAVFVGLLLFGAAANADPGPRYFDYQVKLPPPPADDAAAAATLDQREQAALAAMACGDELSFASDSVNHEADENTTARVLAKIEWGAGHPDGRMHPRVAGECRFSLSIRWPDLATPAICKLDNGAAAQCNPKAIWAEADKLWQQLLVGDLSTFRDVMLARGSRHGPPQGSRIDPGTPSCLMATLSDGSVANSSVVTTRRLDPLDAAKLPTDMTSPPFRSGTVQIDFALTQECLLDQAARALQAMTIPIKDHGQQRAGTDGMLCHLFGTISGDWDMAERNLIRIAYLIKKYDLANRPLLHDANVHLRNDLLTLDRGLDGDSHNVIFGCGNSPGHTGSAEDRVIDRGGHDNPPGDALGDLGWFLLMLLILLALLLAAAALAAAIAALASTLVAAIIGLALVAAAIAAVALLYIPETENHLLGINTAKYLNNQLIMEDMDNDPSVIGPYVNDQIELKAWLLKRMQGFLQEDFIEYNAHPYQRHAIELIRNIFDYAGDPGRPNLQDNDLRNAAQLVLDYTAAKFAVGSSQGRRMVPYRRHRSDLGYTIDADTLRANGMFDFAGGADHQAALGLLYAGQTQQLPLGQASRGFAAEIINATTSDYAPEATILDIAIRKDVPIYQRIHHATEEIYSSGSGFLISAGGLATGLPYPVTGIAALDGHKDDWGAGVPTTLFLSGPGGPDLGFLATSPPTGDPAIDEQLQIYQGQQLLAGPGRAPPSRKSDPFRLVGEGVDTTFDMSVDGIYAKYLGDLSPDAKVKSTLAEFIRIKGEYHVDYDTDDNGNPIEMRSYDNNLCVWDGFACGTNIDLGPMAIKCAADTNMPPWTFIDTANCPWLKTAPRSFIALFMKDCPSGLGCTNFGFFEVIEADRYAMISNPAPGEDLFKKFHDQITTANASLLTLQAGTNMVADYHSARGQKLEFSCWGHETDGDQWGIFHVDSVVTHELGAWPLAGGEWSGAKSLLRPEVQTPMRGIGDGIVEITSPRLFSPTNPATPRVLRLDFSDRDHPIAPMEK